MDSDNFFKFNNGDKTIFLLGVKHSYDSLDPQFTEIKKHWNAFLTETEGKPKVAVTESWPGGSHLFDPLLAIKSGGETGFITSLAFSSGIGVTCFEPDRAFELRHLEKLFDKSVIALYYFIRPFTQWYRLPEPRVSMNQYIPPFIEREKRYANWKDFDFSLDNLKILYKDMAGKSLEETTSEEFVKMISPVASSYSTNKVAKSLHDFRNETIIQNLKRYFEFGNNIFIVYGAGHFKTLRDNIESHLTSVSV